MNRARVKPGGGGRGSMQTLPAPPPQFHAKQKFFCRNYPISVKASREAQMQNFKTMMVAVRTSYITITMNFKTMMMDVRTVYITVTIDFWPLHFYRYTAGPDQTN